MREKTSQAEGLATRSSMAEKVQCRFCDKKFPRNNLKGHEKRHWESESNRESKAQCRFCDKRISRNYLKGHEKRHMESQSCQALPCGQCDKVFNSEQKVSKHIHVVHKPKQVACTDCGKLFRYEKAMQLHRDAIHLKLRKFACHICSRTFTDSSPLRYHIMRHQADPDARIKCTECEKTFALQVDLDSHFRNCHIYRTAFHCCR